MIQFNTKTFFVISILLLSAFSMGQSNVFATGPTAPDLGAAGTFGVLASTYGNSGATSIAGDLGYTTGPGVPPTVTGTSHVADTAYANAGIAQNDATSSANSQACTTSYNTGLLSAINGSIYTPGVYCISVAASTGTGITLSGNGIYIFKIAGALDTVASTTSVALTDGADASKVFWVPTGATTLGANTKFAGTILDASGVTIGNNVNMTGRVLAFGGTVSTDADTITVTFTASVPTCGISVPSTIDFGTLDKDQIVGNPPDAAITLAFTNNGTVDAIVTVAGTDWTDSNHIEHVKGQNTVFETSDVISSQGNLPYASKTPLNSSNTDGLNNDGFITFGDIIPGTNVNATNWGLKAVLDNLPFHGLLTQTITFSATC